MRFCLAKDTQHGRLQQQLEILPSLKTMDIFVISYYLVGTRMKIETHTVNDIKVAEVITDDLVIKTADDGLSLLGDLYYQGFDKIIIHRKNISADFFDLKNGMAGEVLQKFSNYRVKLAIVGDFVNNISKSLRDFVYESNRHGQTTFVSTVAEALKPR